MKIVHVPIFFTIMHKKFTYIYLMDCRLIESEIVSLYSWRTNLVNHWSVLYWPDS